MGGKLREIKCKACKELFTQRRFMQYVCSPKCSIDYQNTLKVNKEAKEWRDTKAVMKVTTHAKEYKADLQREINKLSRMIDFKFGFITCIDCGKPFGKQIDACHFHGRGGNSSLRYNLHNLHSGKSDCNQFSDTHKQGYAIGLADRYGNDYAIMVIEGLPLLYKEIHVSSVEVVEKLKIAREIIRHFDTYDLTDSISARNLFNKLINIYA